MKNLKLLTQLQLKSNKIDDVEPLCNLTLLRLLDLDTNEITNISFLQKLHQVKVLFLQQNQIKDISVLSNLKELAGLNISKNYIKDILVLSKLPLLKILCIHENRIEDVTPLKDFKYLKYLFLAKNPIQNIWELRNIRLKHFAIHPNELMMYHPHLQDLNIENLHLTENIITRSRNPNIGIMWEKEQWGYLPRFNDYFQFIRLADYLKGFENLQGLTYLRHIYNVNGATDGLEEMLPDCRVKVQYTEY